MLLTLTAITAAAHVKGSYAQLKIEQLLVVNVIWSVQGLALAGVPEDTTFPKFRGEGEVTRTTMSQAENTSII